MQLDVDLSDWLTAFEGVSVALSLDEAACTQQNFYHMDFTGPVAFIVGNEGAGLSVPVMQATSARARIPMPGKIESLNAAAALAVATFEAVRQRIVQDRKVL
jgi:TrmH family RNA methyltransferase